MASTNLSQLLHKKAAEAAPSVGKEKINAYEAVRQCLVEIRGCRKRKFSWEEIAALVKSVVLEEYGIQVKLTGTTTKGYYYELTRKKRSSRHSTSHKVARQTKQSKAQLPGIVHFPPEEAKAEEPKEVEPIEMLTPVAPTAEELVQEGTSSKQQQDEPSAETAQQTDEHSQSDPYQRPPGSRFTKGHKVKYWKGGNS